LQSISQYLNEGMVDHLKRNWGKYALGAAAVGGLAYGLNRPTTTPVLANVTSTDANNTTATARQKISNGQVTNVPLTPQAQAAQLARHDQLAAASHDRWNNRDRGPIDPTKPVHKVQGAQIGDI